MREKIRFLNSQRVRNRQIVIWGAGNWGKEMYCLLKKYGYPVVAFVDSDKNKMGVSNGLPVYQPDYLIGKTRTVFIIVAIEAYFSEIKDYLYEHDYAEKVDFFWVKRTLIEPELIDGEYQDDLGNFVQVSCKRFNLHLELRGRNNRLMISDDTCMSGRVFITMSNGSELSIMGGYWMRERL